MRFQNIFFQEHDIFTIFQEGVSVRRTDVVPSHRAATNFPRNPYLVFEQPFIFQEALSSPRYFVNRSR